MVKALLVAPLIALALNACVLAPSDDGYGFVMAPALPAIVELGAAPYYYQRGYYYFYDNNRWRYSHSRSGPWSDLPRNRYPRETRFNGRPDGRRGDDHDRRDRQ